jgi:hypothetical protein
MATDREAFLAGDRPTDVHIYLSEDAISNAEALSDHGERVDDGIVLVMDGERARTVFQRATGIDPMAFAQQAMGTDGDVAPNCTDGTCPADEDGEHAAQFVFAFAEEQNEDVGDLYAEGDVIHAYVACACGERYSDKWVAEERDGSHA